MADTSPNIDAEMATASLADSLAQTSQDARLLSDIIDAQRREMALEDNEELAMGAPPGTTSSGPRDKHNRNTIWGQVPKFTGTHPTYTWEVHLISLEIAEMNQSYTETERKQLLLQSLDGAARMYLMANKQLIHGKYEAAKASLTKRFASKKTHSLTKLREMSMTTTETVLLWYTRLRAVGDTIVATEMLTDELQQSDPAKWAQIKGQKDTLELLLLDQFKRGLRPNIRAAMKTEHFTTIDECARAAEDAEDFLAATSTMVTSNHIGVSPGSVPSASTPSAQVNHASASAVGQVQKMNDRDPLAKTDDKKSEKKSGKTDLSEIECYLCHEFGHYARDCPKRKRRGSKSPRRSGSRQKSINHLLVEQMAMLTEQLDRMSSRRGRYRRRSRSHSRSRRHRRRSSSRRSSRHSSSSRSGSRSSSRGSKGRRVSYAMSSKN